MDSFEELGLSPELVEALASEGIERPTALQEAAFPVIRRGNNLLLAAAPGAGTLVAWGGGVLERLPSGSGRPGALVLTPTPETARALAESMQRLGSATGHAVAALGSAWALPERADILFATARDVARRAGAGDLDLMAVEVLVIDQADLVERLSGWETVEQVVGFLPKEGQRVVVALPVTAGVADFVSRHARRAARVPAESAAGTTSSPRRGALRYLVAPTDKDVAVLGLVAGLLEAEVRHVLVYCRSEDRAADLGDYLSLHGYLAGAPGDVGVPVWLGVEELGPREAAKDVDGVAVLSLDVPADPDSLDRRHGWADAGTVVVLPREVAHLREVARRTGYSLEPAPAARAAADDLERFREWLASAVEREDTATYLLALAPLFERYDPAEVAAAAAALLRRDAPPPAPAASDAADPEARTAPTPWVRLFLSVGEREGLSPGDLVGAITGEAGVPGTAVGKIEIRDAHSIVEVQEPVARTVIKALNGTTIRGRSVRADFDRGRGRPQGGRGRGPRRG